MTTPNFIDANALAARLDMPAVVLRRRRLELEEHCGMPQPLPWARSPLKWRADQIDHWLSQCGLPRAAKVTVDPALVSSGKVRLLAEARRA